MNKQQIIDYVLDSPENTNPAILSQMIDEVGGSGESGDFSTCTGTFVQEGTITTGEFNIECGCCIINDEFKNFDDLSLISDNNKSITFVLYNGHQTIRLVNKTSVSGEINAIEDAPGYYDISGDFTVIYKKYDGR